MPPARLAMTCLCKSSGVRGDDNETLLACVSSAAFTQSSATRCRWCACMAFVAESGLAMLQAAAPRVERYAYTIAAHWPTGNQGCCPAALDGAQAAFDVVTVGLQDPQWG